MVFPSRRPQSFKPVSTSGSVISMTIAIILVLISADRGEGLAKKVRQFSRGQAVSRTPLAIVCAAGLGGQCDQGCQLTDRASCIRKALAHLSQFLAHKRDR